MSDNINCNTPTPLVILSQGAVVVSFATVRHRSDRMALVDIDCSSKRARLIVVHCHSPTEGATNRFYFLTEDDSMHLHPTATGIAEASLPEFDGWHVEIHDQVGRYCLSVLFVKTENARDLRAAHAGAPGQFDDVGVVGVLGANGRDSLVHVGCRDRVEASGADARQLHADHRVAAESAGCHGQTNHAPQGAEFLAHDRLQRHAVAPPGVEVVAHGLGVDAVKAGFAAEHVAQLEVGPVVEVDGALCRAAVAQVSQQQVEPVVQGQRGAGQRPAVVDGIAPIFSLTDGRKSRPVRASAEDRDHRAVAVAVCPDALGQPRLLPFLAAHGVAKGAARGATVSTFGCKAMQNHMMQESGGGRGIPVCGVVGAGQPQGERGGPEPVLAASGAKRGATEDDADDIERAQLLAVLDRLRRRAVMAATRLPAGLTEAELFAAYGVEVRS